MGRLLIPCDNSLVLPDDPYGYSSHVIYSDDHGRTWKLGGVVGPACNESQAGRVLDGTLLMNIRNYTARRPTGPVATSKDGGLTWSAVRRRRRPGRALCQASLLRYTMQPQDDRNLGPPFLIPPTRSRASGGT